MSEVLVDHMGGKGRKEGGSLRRPANFSLAWLIVTGRTRGFSLFGPVQT